jgi:pyroglutamyl-peptidase
VIRVLITGFGPFPGAPFNPTGMLAMRLAKLRRPALAGVARSAHVFRTTYAAVDRDLPRLLAEHQPDVLLMFGLATRRRHVSIETRAQNVVAMLPDRDRRAAPGRSIAAGMSARTMKIPVARLLAAVRAANVPVKRSRDAGTYLCNYLCWRSIDAAGKRGGPALTAFVHVPNIRRMPMRNGAQKRLTLDDLVRAGSAILIALAAASKRR